MQGVRQLQGKPRMGVQMSRSGLWSDPSVEPGANQEGVLSFRRNVHFALPMYTNFQSGNRPQALVLNIKVRFLHMLQSQLYLTRSNLIVLPHNPHRPSVPYPQPLLIIREMGPRSPPPLPRCPSLNRRHTSRSPRRPGAYRETRSSETTSH